jgi:uncharacterized protein
MEIDWDEEKDAQNRAKHGVGLGEAAFLDWHVGTEFQDARYDYGEERHIRMAMLVDRYYICVFTLRGQKRRIISLRKANKREIRFYGI